MWHYFLYFVLLASVHAGYYGPGAPPRLKYDYIVIGTGDSGSVVAKRLIDDSRNFKVLVLEAGFPSQAALGGIQYAAPHYDVDANGKYVPGLSRTVFDVPAFYTITYNNGQAVSENGIPTGADWGIGGNYNVFQGKIIGGSGAHNGMVWVRGAPGNFAQWNVTGWSYNDILPYYKKCENATYNGSQNNPAVHGYSGPLNISDSPIVQQEGQITIQSCINAGYPKSTDVNAQDSGCGVTPFNVRNGVRDSTAIGYLLPALGNANLDVLFYAQATALNLNGTGANLRATGVNFTNLLTNISYTVEAAVEVILAAGPLNTPKLLYFSGVGPAAQLTKFGIPVKLNNPNVGIRIRNTFGLNIVYESPKAVNPNLNFLPNAALLYAQQSTGYYAAPSTTVTFWLKSNPNFTVPDLTLADRYTFPPYADTQHSFTISPASPVYADGYINLTSKNPLDPFNLTQPILMHQEDVNTFVTGIRVMRKILATQPAASFFGPEVTPGANETSDTDLENFVRTPGVVSPVSHFAGSCKMGNTGDPLAVVNPQLQLNGVKAVRIVDSSINAGPLRFFPHATAVAVAEKASDLILAAAPSSSQV